GNVPQNVPHERPSPLYARNVATNFCRWGPSVFAAPGAGGKDGARHFSILCPARNAVRNFCNYARTKYFAPPNAVILLGAPALRQQRRASVEKLTWKNIARGSGSGTTAKIRKKAGRKCDGPEKRTRVCVTNITAYGLHSSRPSNSASL